MKPNKVFAAFVALLIWMGLAGKAAGNETAETLSFGVISQRSPLLLAQFWNPILRHVSERSGIPLELKLTKTGPEHAAAILRGEYDLIYSNHNFTRDNDKVGYSVFARPLQPAIRGQIIVPIDSPIQSLAELQGKDVVFPSTVAFVGYTVTMDLLNRKGITVNPLFAGNQEGAMGQLISGRAVAAGINSQVAQAYAKRQNIEYRVLWSSEEFLDIPLSSHPRVPKAKTAAVRAALLNMSKDPEGKKILAESARLIHLDSPFGFISANDSEFDNVRKVYRNTPLHDGHP